MALNIKFFEGLERIKEIVSVGYIPVDTKARKDSKRLASSGSVKEVEEKADAASEALQEQIDDIAEKAGSGYIPKGEADVATLNGLSGQENGWLYTMTDSGTLTDGSVAVVAGDTVAWDATNSVWYKAMDYAPRQYGTNEVHNLSTTITAFRTGDVIPVDGPSGAAKMRKDDLLKETAQNALAGNVAPAFDPTRTNVNQYSVGEKVCYGGKTYIFKNSHYGAWNASDVDAIDILSFLDVGYTEEFVEYSFDGSVHSHYFEYTFKQNEFYCIMFVEPTKIGERVNTSLFVNTTNVQQLNGGSSIPVGTQYFFIANKNANRMGIWWNPNSGSPKVYIKHLKINSDDLQGYHNFVPIELQYFHDTFYKTDGTSGTASNLNIHSCEFDLTPYIGEIIRVVIGTEAAAYLVIEDVNDDVIFLYQSRVDPITILVTPNMKTAKFGGYVIDGRFGVYRFKPYAQVNASRAKSVAFFGDSITYGYNTLVKYATLISDRLGCTLYNYAVSGYQTTGVISKIASATDDSDIVFVMAGTNDWALGNLSIGNMYSVNVGTKVLNYDTTTFYGRINTLLKDLCEKYPKSRKIIMTPLHRKTYKTQYASDLVPNSSGAYLEEFVNAIKASASYFSVECLDMWSESEMNPNVPNVATAYFFHKDDGVDDFLHPDLIGHIHIAEIIMHRLQID